LRTSTRLLKSLPNSCMLDAGDISPVTGLGRLVAVLTCWIAVPMFSAIMGIFRCVAMGTGHSALMDARHSACHVLYWGNVDRKPTHPPCAMPGQRLTLLHGGWWPCTAHRSR
jgi:hypothetical protein